MKKVSFLFLVLCLLNVFGQKIDFVPTIKVQYNSVLKLGEKYQKSQEFILVGNSQDYYFAGVQNYLNDTGQYKSKGIDTRVYSDYFQERLIKENGITTVFFVNPDNKIRYEERLNLKWVLYDETKIINGVKCQMAATNKYGRRWIAYFSKEYPQSLGPYKFTGLPGLIFELYDTRDDYHFTLSKVEKFTDDFEYNFSGFKNFPKDKYLKAKYNLENTFEALPGLVITLEERKYYESLLEKGKKMHNNPLELKPFE